MKRRSFLKSLLAPVVANVSLLHSETKKTVQKVGERFRIYIENPRKNGFGFRSQLDKEADEIQRIVRFYERNPRIYEGNLLRLAEKYRYDN